MAKIATGNNLEIRISLPLVLSTLRPAGRFDPVQIFLARLIEIKSIRANQVHEGCYWARMGTSVANFYRFSAATK
jgi:hypothetical protein